jgi:hypothetical protein
LEVANDTELRFAMNKEYNILYDLSTGPLYRLSIFSTGTARVVMIVAHRIPQQWQYQGNPENLFALIC